IDEDLLDRASLDAGRLALHREPTTVLDVMSATQAIFMPIAEEQAVELVTETPADLPIIDADARRLVQVLVKLLSNALKFTQRGGRVRLSAQAVDAKRSDGHRSSGRARGVRFAVSDTGLGIASEDLAHIFDWFWQPPGVHSGSGLGLAIARGLIEA